MTNNVEHEKWINKHMQKRSNRRLDALKRGHGFGNQLFLKSVWWPLLGHFENLHPEYEVLDWRGYPFYIDFVWIFGPIRIAFEIQDFGSHVKNKDRLGYRKELNRGMFLQSLGYTIVYISLDEIKENPRLIISLISTILNPYINVSKQNNNKFTRIEKDLMRISVINNRILFPFAAAKELDVSSRTVVKHMKNLVNKGKFRPIITNNSNRICRYEFIGSLTDPDML